MTWDAVAILDAGGHPLIYADPTSRDGWYVIALGPPDHASSEE